MSRPNLNYYKINKWAIKVIFLLIFTFYIAGVNADSWQYTKGKGYPLCEGVYRRLSNFIKSDAFNPEYKSNSCVWDLTLTYPDFSEPPWREIDVKQQKLVVELMKYLYMGRTDYFTAKSSESDSVEGVTLSASQIQQRASSSASDFYAQGGRVFVWRTKLVNNFLTLNYSAPPTGIQTIIKLEYPSDIRPENKFLCPKLAKTSGRTNIFFVKDDLTGPDHRVEGAYDLLSGHEVKLYKGKAYFLGASAIGGVTIGRDFGTGPTDFCEINYIKSNAK